MGRAKIPMKYIQNERSRKMAFRQRKKGLIKKTSEFCIRSEAKACLIVYDGDDNNVGPTIWPENPIIVNSMLQEYEHQKIEKTPEIFDVNDYFENKKDMAEAQITKVRKAIIKNNYSTWHPEFNNMEEHQLRNFIATLDGKIQVCDHKINMLKNMQQSETNFLQNNAHMQNMVQESVVSSHSNQVNGIHSIPQMQQQINNIREMVEKTNHDDLPSSTNQFHDISKMVNFNHGYFPPSTSTNRLSELVECGQAVNPDYISESVEFTSHSDLPPSSSTNQLSQPVDHDGWIKYLDKNVLAWASQPDQFAWKDPSFSSQNEEDTASLDCSRRVSF